MGSFKDNLSSRLNTGKINYLAVPLALALGFAFTVGGSVGPEASNTFNGVPMLADDVAFDNPVTVYKNGEPVVETTNALMEAEDAVLAEVTSSDSGDNYQWNTIALGQGTAPTDGSTSLQGEKSSNGLSPQTATLEDVGDGTWNLTATFTATGTDTVSTTAVKSQNAPSDIDYFAGTGFGRELNVQSGDEIEVEWQLKVD